MRIVVSIALTFLMLAVRADSPELSDLVPEAPAESESSVIDEITVVEQRNVIQLRVELKKADDRLFSLYNDLNENDSLDIICKNEARTGSQIKHRVCKSAYDREIESEAGSEMLDDGTASTLVKAPAGHYSKVRANMDRLMNEHPELMQAFYQRAILRHKINELKKK